MYIYKYISNLQTYNLRVIYCTFMGIAVSVRLFFLKFTPSLPPPDTLFQNTLYTQLKPGGYPHKFNTHTLTHTLSHTLSITSRHPPLCNNQVWLYHQTGRGPVTCAACLERTPATGIPESSSPSSSYASGPPGPPWTEQEEETGSLGFKSHAAEIKQ